MRLPTEAIREFKVLFQKQYGITLSDEEATLRATNLLKLYKAVYGPPDYEIILNRQGE